VKPYYQDESCTIYHGDCREVRAWLVADVLVTDPPYGINWSRGLNKVRASKAHEGIANDGDTSARDEVLFMASDKPALVFGSFYAPFPLNTRQLLVWQKPPDAGVVGSTTGYRRDAEPIFIVGPWPQRTVQWSSVIRDASTSIKAVAAQTGHPHTKPLGLLRMLISRCPEGLISDPFMGTGTTLRAAKDLGRKAIGIEIEEAYCEIAAKRLSQSVLPLNTEEAA
jgi:DNA modification methylase